MAKTIKYKKINKLNNEEFKRITGVTKDVFKQMVKVLTQHYKLNRAKGGRKSNHTPSDQVLMMLEYYRDYRTFKSIAVDYNTSESTVHYVVTKVESILIKDKRFHLPSLKRKEPQNNENEVEIIIIDATETPCERPKKRQKKYYSGKKKRHTIKTQIIGKPNGEILSVHIDKGKIHDFKIFKKSKDAKRVEDRLILADSGYQGIAKICKNASTPHKKTKKKPLTKEQKNSNRELSSKRIAIEQINARIKVFKILKYPYRNRRKRFGLRMNLICGIINLERSLKVAA